MDGFFDYLAGRLDGCRGLNGLDGLAGEALEARRRELAAALAESSGLALLRSLGREAAPLPPPSARDVDAADGVSRVMLDFEYLPGLRGPVQVYSPRDEAALGAAERRVVVYCPGHDDRHESFHDEGWKPPFRENAADLARAGFVVAVPTFAGFSDMAVRRYKEPQLAGCYAIASRLYLYGISLAALRVFQVEAVRDALADRYPRASFGIYGMSGGGEVAAYAHALLPGFAATMVAGYASDYSNSIMAMEHCLCNYVIGAIAEVGELGSILALGAPRPLFVSNGLRDPIFPIDGARACYERLRSLYRSAGAEGALCLEEHDGAHEASYRFQRSWFERQLSSP